MNIVITGANRGIGLELTKQYALNHHVYALCRQSNHDLNLIPNVTVIENVDVTNSSSIHLAVNQCPNEVDLLINNAGILKRVSIDQLDPSVMNEQWNVNALGPLKVTHAFLNSLSKQSKVILMTSRMGSIADNDSGSHYGYRMSKAALNMAGKSLSIDLKDRDIYVGIVHPGWVQTDMTGHTGHYSVDKAASQIIDCINQINELNTGQFWHSNGDQLPW